MKAISVVIPVYNEMENVQQLHAEIIAVCRQEGYICEIIFIDDGSTDGTAEVLQKLRPVKVIHFRRNFGQTAAFDAGFKAAHYDYVVTMDGDGQNDPADIPRLLNHLEKHQMDIVSGWRKDRKDRRMKRILSHGANHLRKLMINDQIHDSGCSLKIYRRYCMENLNLYGEMHRFIPALLKIKGYKTGELKVNHRPRTSGHTKYNWERTVKGFIDLISIWFWNKYAVRPLHLLGGMGLLLIIGGMVTLVFAFIQWISGQSMSDSALPLLTVFLFLGGIQMFISGLIADTLLKSYYETTRNQAYSIRKIVENKEDDAGGY